MPLAVDPVPTGEELAAIVAALDQAAPPAQNSPPAAPSRWRAAGRIYDGEAESLR